MYELKHFENGPLQAEIRTLYIDGIVWFVLMDVARVFGYRDSGRVLHMLRDSQWLQADDAIRDALGVRGRAPYLVNESGFYRLASRSTRSEAEPFQVWVEDEVLPSIRREGGYISDKATAEQLEVLRERLQMSELAQEIHQVQIAAAKAEGWRQGVKAGRYSSRNDETMANPYSDEVLQLLPKYVEADEIWAIDLQEEFGGEDED